MSKREPKLLVEDILQSIEYVFEDASGMDYGAFIASRTKRNAIERNLEIIGEAIRQLPEEFKQKFSHIPWHLAKGFRNRIIHEYFELDYKIVWEIIEVDLPKLQQQLSAIKFDE